jgi:hypothetical protein
VRSEKSKAQRAAYARAWRERNPDYHRRWRAEHRASENARKARNRALKGRQERPRPSRAYQGPEIGPTHTGHELFDAARQIVGERRGTLSTLYDPLYDDLLSVATLALVEGDDPVAAVTQYRKKESRWGRGTAPLLGEPQDDAA